MKFHRYLLVQLSFVLLAVAGTSCTVKDRCDPDQADLMGQCLPLEEETSEGDSATTDESGGGAGGAGEQSSTGADEAPNLGAKCTDHPDCKGGTVCGAEGGQPQCFALCGEGDAFENGCPSGTKCTRAGPASVCL